MSIYGLSDDVADSRARPMITVWAEEAGKLVAGTAEWSFGGGAQ